MLSKLRTLQTDGQTDRQTDRQTNRDDQMYYRVIIKSKQYEWDVHGSGSKQGHVSRLVISLKAER